MTIAFAAGLSLAGCIIEASPSRYWIENKTDNAIVVRQPVENGYLRVTRVPAHQRVEVDGLVAKDFCTPGFEIADESGKRLRTIGKICDGDTVVYP